MAAEERRQRIFVKGTSPQVLCGVTWRAPRVENWATGQRNRKELVHGHEAIVKGDCSNPTVVPSVRSNMTAVLGREAGYRGGTLTWQELASANKVLKFDTRGLKD